MLILEKLVLNNIGRFNEEQTINFNSLGNLVQVEGQNNNTGGSSGSGKTTFFRAIEFLLGLNSVSNSILQCRYSKETISVTGYFSFDGLPLKIERGKKLLIDLNGEITTGSSKLAEEKLDQILSMPRDLFRKILHKRQKEPAFFLNLTPAESHSFLTSCLKLEDEQAKITKLEEKLKALLDQELSLKSTLDTNKAAYGATQIAIDSLGLAPILENNPELLLELENKLFHMNQAISATKTLHEKELSDLEEIKPIIVTSRFNRSGIEFVEKEICTIVSHYTFLEDLEKQRCGDIKVEIAELQNQASKLQQMELTRQNDCKSEICKLQIAIRDIEKKEQLRQSKAQSELTANHLSILKRKSDIENGDRAKASATVLAQELQKVRASLCPTCEQNWINDAAKAKEVDILNKLQELKKIVVLGIEASKELSILEENSKQLTLELNPKSIPEIDENNNKINQFWLKSQPIEVPEAEEIKKQIRIKQNDIIPRSISEAIELRVKKDFKEKELLNLRQIEAQHFAKESKANQERMAEYNQKRVILCQMHQNTLQALNDKKTNDIIEFENAKNKIKCYEENKNRFIENKDRLIKELTKYGNLLNDKGLELNKIQEEIEIATLAKLVVKSYLSCAFESALESIGDEATRMIRQIPNMATATLQFEGLRETKDGKIKEEITCLLSMDGEVGVPIKSISGGEGSAADLAVDLSVVKFIGEQTGKGINIMCLDEFTNGLDTVCIQDTIEMLRSFSADKKLLLIEHNPIVSQCFENKILVIRDGLTSRITQQ